tara:strand:+ start:1260 stop:3242 length:1983 start_codon:yes stop_codon:yes gene_type:complete
MDNFDFKALVQNEIQAAVNYHDSSFSSDRSEILGYYLGDKFGNEQENRSQVVLTEVSDTIEFIMPQLLKIFASSNDFARFVGREKEDIKSAEQATQLVNFVINSQNNGFSILHNWFKDALLFKLGALKFFWEETETTVNEEYNNLSEDELVLLLEDKNIEIVSQESVEQGFIDENAAVPVSEFFNVEVKRKTKGGKVKIENVPPEELIFSPRSKSLEDCDFIAHRTTMRAGDLIERGFDPKVVQRYAGGENSDHDGEIQKRFQEIDAGEEGDSKDPSMKEVIVNECYIRCDFDGDDIPELRRVVVFGDSGEIVSNEPFDHIPFSILSPILMPHRMVGRSVAEMVMDIQLIKSSILRSQLDNLYLTNNSRVAVVEGQVNLDDLLNSRPAGIVRMRQQGAVQPLQVPQLGSQGFAMLEYMDQVRDQRTGFSKQSLGLDPKALQSTTAAAVTSTIQGSQLKVEMIARVFAETGCKNLAFGVLHLLQKHQDKSVTVRINNEYVNIDPRAFDNKFDIEVDVGLGNGVESDKLNMLIQIAGKQEQILQTLGPSNPVVSTSQYVNTLKKIANMAGFKDTDQFFTSGETVDESMKAAANEEPEESVEMQKLKADMLLKRERMQAELALEREKLQMEMQMRKAEFEAELSLRQQKMSLGGDISTNLPRV